MQKVEVKGSERRQSAFVICEAGTDIKPLADILTRVGVETLNRRDTVGSEPVFHTTLQLLNQADFVIAILDGFKRSNVLFEIGVAVGRNKRIAVIDRDPNDLLDLPNIFHIRASLYDDTALFFQLKAFASSFSLKPSKRAARQTRPLKNIDKPSKVVGEVSISSDLERDVLQAFQRADEVTAIVSQPRVTGYKTYIPDFAIWTTDTLTDLDGPTIVEVKSDLVKNNRYVRAIDQLKNYAGVASVSAGLLLVRTNEPLAPSVESLSPFIVIVGVEECKRLLTQRSLVKTLRRERNQYAHSAS